MEVDSLSQFLHIPISTAQLGTGELLPRIATITRDKTNLLQAAKGEKRTRKKNTADGRKVEVQINRFTRNRSEAQRKSFVMSKQALNNDDLKDLNRASLAGSRGPSAFADAEQLLPSQQESFGTKTKQTIFPHYDAAEVNKMAEMAKSFK